MVLCLLLQVALRRWLLKKIDALHTPKPDKPPQKWQTVNPLCIVVTTDEQFQEILAEAQKKQEMEKEKRERKEERERKKIEKIKQGKISTKGIKNKALKEENYQENKILTIMVRNPRVQRPASQSGMKMCTKMSNWSQ